MKAYGRVAGWFGLLGFLAGCAAEFTSPSRLDSSGLTVVTESAAVVFANPARTLASGARDYAYLGPVEINRMGHRQYYFWVGLASTIDQDYLQRDLPNADTLVLIVNGEPMSLPLSEWQTDLDVPPYESSAPVYRVFSADTSISQIHRIADAEFVELYLLAGDELDARYLPWDRLWTGWREFPAEQQ
ncbi:MAG: hypothetical protein OEM63_02270 [Gammaproteobacteria bacterium]|nr:hypothetical protein [Gammaproteobacteria bacterium]